jgi:tetratricopeptide (TPR) repeat protein
MDRRALVEADSLLHAYPGALDANADLAILAAQLAKKAGRLDEAATLYRSALRDASAAADAYTELARLELDRHRFAEAVDAARQALRLQPDRTEARMTLLQALLKCDRPAEATDEARRLPAGAARDRFVGQALLALGQADSAVVALRRAHEAQPDSDTAAYLLGQAELLLGNAEQAARVLRPLAARPEPYEDAQRELEAAYRSMGRPTAADSLARAYQQTVRRREALAMRVEGLQKSAAGDLPGALHSFQRARELDAALVDLANDLGAVYARLGRYAEAQSELTRAARLRPDDAAIQRNLANLYQITGDTLRRDEALRRFRELTTPAMPEGTTRSSRTPR